MVKLIEGYNPTEEERIELIKDFIKRVENDDIDTIAENVIDQYEVWDGTKEKAVCDGYSKYFCIYFEDEEDGCDFVEEYYGDYTDTFYKELEQAVEEYVSTFSKDDIDSIFEVPDDPYPGNMDRYINGSGYSHRYRFPDYGR